MAEEAYCTIRDLILRGKLPLGAALSRRRLGAELGMSMLPISEAVQRLESEGFLESKPQVGTRVRVPTAHDVRERLIIREALEVQAARLVAERATMQQRNDLRLMAEHMDTLSDRMTANKEDAAFAFAVHSYHSQFHLRVAEYSGSPALQEMIQRNNVLVFNWLFDMTSRQIANSHQELTEALTGTDPSAAEAAMRRHVQLGLEETLSAVQRLQVEPRGKWRLGRDVTKAGVKPVLPNAGTAAPRNGHSGTLLNLPTATGRE
jgi:DNA-binding GntR family transcriptional regulator